MNYVDRRGVNPLDRHGVTDTALTRQSAPVPGRIMAHFSHTNRASLVRSTQMYSMYEALARERQREQREQAARQRLSRQLASLRLWQRLAAYSAGRATRSRYHLAEQPAADYQLAG
jgi:hypothetical protein